MFWVFLKLINYFIYFWLCWVFISVRGLPLVAASGGHSSSRCACLSLSRPLPLRSTGFRHAGSVVVAHGPRCSAACGILPDQGSNPCPLHWQADSQSLHHQGSPHYIFLFSTLQGHPSLVSVSWKHHHLSSWDLAYTVPSAWDNLPLYLPLALYLIPCNPSHLEMILCWEAFPGLPGWMTCRTFPQPPSDYPCHDMWHSFLSS